eukprot:g1175.t1
MNKKSNARKSVGEVSMSVASMMRDAQQRKPEIFGSAISSSLPPQLPPPLPPLSPKQVNVEDLKHKRREKKLVKRESTSCFQLCRARDVDSMSISDGDDGMFLESNLQKEYQRYAQVAEKNRSLQSEQQKLMAKMKGLQSRFRARGYSLGGFITKHLLHSMDSDTNGEVNIKEFRKSVMRSGVKLSVDDVDLLVEIFGVSKYGLLYGEEMQESVFPDNYSLHDCKNHVPHLRFYENENEGENEVETESEKQVQDKINIKLSRVNSMHSENENFEKIDNLIRDEIPRYMKDTETTLVKRSSKRKNVAKEQEFEERYNVLSSGKLHLLQRKLKSYARFEASKFSKFAHQKISMDVLIDSLFLDIDTKSKKKITAISFIKKIAKLVPRLSEKDEKSLYLFFTSNLKHLSEVKQNDHFILSNFGGVKEFYDFKKYVRYEDISIFLKASNVELETFASIRYDLDSFDYRDSVEENKVEVNSEESSSCHRMKISNVREKKLSANMKKNVESKSKMSPSSSSLQFSLKQRKEKIPRKHLNSAPVKIQFPKFKINKSNRGIHRENIVGKKRKKRKKEKKKPKTPAKLSPNSPTRYWKQINDNKFIDTNKASDNLCLRKDFLLEEILEVHRTLKLNFLPHENGFRFQTLCENAMEENGWIKLESLFIAMRKLIHLSSESEAIIRALFKNYSCRTVLTNSGAIEAVLIPVTFLYDFLSATSEDIEDFYYEGKDFASKHKFKFQNETSNSDFLKRENPSVLHSDTSSYHDIFLLKKKNIFTNSVDTIEDDKDDNETSFKIARPRPGNRESAPLPLSSYEQQYKRYTLKYKKEYQSHENEERKKTRNRIPSLTFSPSVVKKKSKNGYAKFCSKNSERKNKFSTKEKSSWNVGDLKTTDNIQSGDVSLLSSRSVQDDTGFVSKIETLRRDFQVQTSDLENTFLAEITDLRNVVNTIAEKLDHQFKISNINETKEIRKIEDVSSPRSMKAYVRSPLSVTDGGFRSPARKVQSVPSPMNGKVSPGRKARSFPSGTNSNVSPKRQAKSFLSSIGNISPARKAQSFRLKDYLFEQLDEEDDLNDNYTSEEDEKINEKEEGKKNANFAIDFFFFFSTRQEVEKKENMTSILSNYTAYGAGLHNAIAGEASSFIIVNHSKEKSFLKTKDRISFSVFLKKKKKKKCYKRLKINDNGDESYTCNYIAPIEPGMYEITITCHGIHLRNSPFSLKVDDENVFSEVSVDDCNPDDRRESNDENSNNVICSPPISPSLLRKTSYNPKSEESPRIIQCRLVESSPRQKNVQPLPPSPRNDRNVEPSPPSPKIIHQNLRLGPEPPTMEGLWKKYTEGVFAVFQQYANPKTGVITRSNFIQLLRRKSVVPRFLSEKAARSCLQENNANFTHFKSALNCVAAFAFNQPLFSPIYKTAAEQLEALLVTWGLADSSSNQNEVLQF